jgi:dienelactone hydrolase
VQHAIDTSWSQPHTLLTADIDGDGRDELIAGKRYMGHDGKDPGEYDPLVIYAYDFDRDARTWRRQTISEGGRAGFGLDPKAVDLDGDGDIDLLAPARSGLFWFENLLNQQEKRPAPSATPAPVYPDHTDVSSYVDAAGRLQPIKTPADWALRRSHVLAQVEKVMGPLPGPSRRVALDVTVLSETRTPAYVRKQVTFAAEPGDRVPAYLLVPHEINWKAPAMLCLHQTTRIGKGEPAGLGGLDSLHYAHELAERGYVCIVPDYPSFGDYAYDFKNHADRYVSGSMKAIWNNIRAIDLLGTLPYVDPDRIGCIGHSLGGHNTIFTAVFDQRIRVAVSSCGFTAFGDYYEGNLAGWTSDRYMPRIREQYGNDPARVPFDFPELVAALAPRPFFVNAPLGDSNFAVVGVRKVIDRASEIYALREAKDNLQVVYPEAAHSFPDAVRASVYDWLDGWLKPKKE